MMEHLIASSAENPLGRAEQPAESASIYVQLADPGASFTSENDTGDGMGQP